MDQIPTEIAKDLIKQFGGFLDLRTPWDRLLEYVDRLEERVESIERVLTLKATLTIGGTMAGVGLSIDATDGTATLGYTDDHGDVVDAPADSTPVFSSSDDTIVTVDNSANPLVGVLTPVAVGDFSIDVTGLGTDTLTGTTIPDASASGSIVPGPAADGTVVIAG